MSDEVKVEKNYYGQVPNILFDSDLSIYARALYSYLVKFYGEGKKKYIFEQNLSTIAIMTDMSRDKVISAKKELMQWIIPLIKVVEIKDNSKGGVYHQIFLTDEIWDLQKKHYQALTIKQSNARSGNNLPYCEDDILVFEKTKKLSLAKEKSKASRDDFEARRNNEQSKNRLPKGKITLGSESLGSRNIDCSIEHNTNNSIKDFSSPKQYFDLFTVETQPLLKKYMQLFGITEQMIPTAKNKGNLTMWKNALNKMLKIAEGDSKLAEKMMLRTFNSWSNKNPQFRKDCTSPFNLVNSFKEQYAEFVREQNESAKEKELLSKNTEYISGEDGAKMLKDIQKSLRK